MGHLTHESLLDGMPRGRLPEPRRDIQNITVVGAESFEELETRRSGHLRALMELRGIPDDDKPIGVNQRLEDFIEKGAKPSHYSKTLRSICLQLGFPLERVRFYAKWSDFNNDSSCNPDIIFFDGHGYSGKIHPFHEPHISNGYEHIEGETHPIRKVLQWINEKKGSIFLMVLPICYSIELAEVLRRSDRVEYVFGPDEDEILEEGHDFRLDTIRLLFTEWYS